MAKLENLNRMDIVNFGQQMEQIRVVAGDRDVKDRLHDGKTWFDWYSGAIDAILADDAKMFRKCVGSMERLTGKKYEEKMDAES